MSACYAIGIVTGSVVGGLIGDENGSSSTITDCYFERAASETSPLGIGNLASDHDAQAEAAPQTTGVLQGELTYNNIYANWAGDEEYPWDFGARQYPALKFDVNGDGLATAKEFGMQGRDDTPVIVSFSPRVLASDATGMVLFRIAGINFDATLSDNRVSIDGSPFVAALALRPYMGTGPQAVDTLEVSLSVDGISATGVILQVGTEVVASARFLEREQVVVIDVSNLEQLDAIRYDLNGDGTVDDDANATAYEAAFGTPACAGSCEGYRLTRDLDFEDAASYAGARNDAWVDPTNGGTTDTEGWLPIGTGSDPYRDNFDGQRHTISNIYINRPSSNRAGLFGYVSGRLRNLGIEGGSVRGNETSSSSYTGGLVGEAGGSITSCYATCDVRGRSTGGLVGWVSGSITSCYATGNVNSNRSVTGGLVGYLEGSMTSCYATGNVRSGNFGEVGGLVGRADGSTTTSCYATGNVRGGDFGEVGGLVGRISGSIERRVPVASCYATGNVRGGTSTDVGGLVGEVSGASVSNSYYDNDESSASAAIGGGGTGRVVSTLTNVSGQTTEALQGPTSPEGIYSTWDADVWDFGSGMRYPRLKVDFDGDGRATAGEFGGQTLFFVDEDDAFVYPAFIISEDAAGTTIGVLRAVNDANGEQATLSLAEMSDLFELDGSTLKVKADATFDYSTTSSYTLGIRLLEGTSAATRSVSIAIRNPNDRDEDGDGLIGITTLEQLHAIRFDLNGDGEVDGGVSEADAMVYETAFDVPRMENVVCSGTCGGYELEASLDFEDAASYAGARNDTWVDPTNGGTTDTEGWQQIGTYTTTFEGNGHTISNLYINRPSTDIGWGCLEVHKWSHYSQPRPRRRARSRSTDHVGALSG